MFKYNKTTNKLSFNDNDISDDETIKIINEYLEILKKELIITKNQSNAIQLLKKIHLLEANIAIIETKTIFDNISASIVKNVLQLQIYNGITNSGIRYGIKYLFEQQNQITDSQFKESLRKYSNSGKISYYKIIQQSKINNGFRFCRRFLSGSNNCPDCINYSELGLQLIGSLPVPAEKCVCNTNCKCKIEYYE